MLFDARTRQTFEVCYVFSGAILVCVSDNEVVFIYDERFILG